jgi:hypothetical protein
VPAPAGLHLYLTRRETQVIVKDMIRPLSGVICPDRRRYDCFITKSI